MPVNLIELAKTDPRAQKTLANIQYRADRLFTTSGYTYRPFLTNPAAFYVEIPGDRGLYVVMEHSDRAMTCNCICFTENEVCKHALAIKNILDAERTLCQAYEATIAGAESQTTGCDPYAEF